MLFHLLVHRSLRRIWPKSRHDAYGFGAEGGCKDLLLSTHQSVETPVSLLGPDHWIPCRQATTVPGTSPPPFVISTEPKRSVEISVWMLSLEMFFDRAPDLCALLFARLKIFGKCIGAPLVHAHPTSVVRLPPQGDTHMHK